MIRTIIGYAHIAGVVLLGSTALESTAWAQQAGGIAGIVADTSGGVLPGVTVEAASPVLIEQVRSVVTDGAGRYTVIDLRPGTYTVTFNLPGFSTVIQEGIELTAGFTATVNVQLQVGGVAETITVSGQSPLIDVQNVQQRESISNELLAELPTGTMGLNSYLNQLTLGLSGLADVGGASGIYYANNVRPNAYHGKAGVKMMYNGMRANNMSDSQSYVMNPITAEEVVVETGGVSAESNNVSLNINMIPKEGANTFSFLSQGTFTNNNLQSNNITGDLLDRFVSLSGRGLTTTGKVLTLYDANLAVGGPIRTDRLWFFSATRFSASKNEVPGVFFNKTQGTPVYTPDEARGSAFRREYLKSQAIRLTLQVSDKHKINTFADVQSFHTLGIGRFEAPEAYTCWRFWPSGHYSASWTAPVTSRVLLEAGASLTKGGFPCPRETHFPDLVGGGAAPVRADDISIVEASTGLRYNAKSSYAEKFRGDRYVQRASISYVTGTHNMKAGIQIEEGIETVLSTRNGDMEYRFLQGVPSRLTMYSTPFTTRERMVPDLGLFIQDQWAIRRMTLNLGLRFDYLNAYVGEQFVPASRFVPFDRSFDRVDGVPEWTDVNPRLGVAYDLFGDGRTALKASLGRYVSLMGVRLAGDSNPIVTSVNSVNRSWNDGNGDFVPDCDLLNPAANGECGAFSNSNFGLNNPNATRFSDDVLKSNRDAMWDSSFEIDHELSPAVSLHGGYYRSWSSDMVLARSGTRTGGAGNQRIGRVTDNLAVTPADFDPFCVTAPVDPRLPGGGGYEVCGLYSVNPAKFGQVDNLVTQAANFGEPRRYSDFFSVSIDARLGERLQFSGGVDTGRTVVDACFVVDSPGELLYCNVETPFKAQSQVKFNGSYQLPADFVVSATYKNEPGPQIEANWPAPNAAVAPSLGRNLAGGARTVTVPLLEPQTVFEDRRSQLDMRMSKLFGLGADSQLRVNVDIYNVFNASTILASNPTYGSRWLEPTGNSNVGGVSAILTGRLFQFGGQLTF